MTATFTEAADGTDRVYLDELGTISGQWWSHAYPGGCKAAEMRLSVGPDFRHRALTSRRLLTITRGGAPVWTGRLDSALPGDPWQLKATGNGAFGNDFRALINNNQADVASGNIYDINTSLDRAISRGLPWRRAQTFSTWTGANKPPAALNMSEVLTETADALGLFWQVAVDGAVTMAAAPTAVTRLLTAVEVPAGDTLDEFFDAVYLAYTDSAAELRGVRIKESQPGVARADRIEGFADITGDGTFTAPAAQNAANLYYARSGYRTNFAGDLIAPHGTLLNVGGQPVDGACERAGFLLRVLLVEPDRYGQAAPGEAVETVIAETRYDVDTGVLRLTPQETVRQGLSDLLAQVR